MDAPLVQYKKVKSKKNLLLKLKKYVTYIIGGGSMISHTNGHQPKGREGGGANLLFVDFFPGNCMKLKEIGWGQGRASLTPPWIIQ